MIEKIKSKLQCIPTDVKHLWTNHKKVCIRPLKKIKKKQKKHGLKVQKKKKGNGGMMVIKIAKDKKNKKK